jgi:hypothetical protein
MIYESTKHTCKSYEYYSVKQITFHQGYKNLARIAHKYGNTELWMKYKGLSIEHRVITEITLPSLNHMKLKSASALSFREEFGWLIKTLAFKL